MATVDPAAFKSDSRPPRLPRPLLPAVIVVLLVLRLFWVVTTNVVNMPYMDEWYVWSGLLGALDTKSLSWSVLVEPYNGHRPAVMRLVLLALLPTGWNVYPQVILTALCAATLFGACWYLYRRTARELGVQVNPWVAVGLGAFVFSCADINLLWGMGLVWHGVMLGSTLCLMLLAATPFRWWRLPLAALCATAASFSVGAGLLAWILGIPTLWLAASQAPARLRATLCWSTGAVVFCSLYLRNLGAGPGSTAKWGYVLAHPLEFFGFLVIFLGVPIEPRYDATLLLGRGCRDRALGDCRNLVVAIASHRSSPACSMAGAGGAVGLERNADCRGSTWIRTCDAVLRHGRQALLDLLGRSFLVGPGAPWAPRHRCAHRGPGS